MERAASQAWPFNKQGLGRLGARSKPGFPRNMEPMQRAENPASAARCEHICV